MANTKDAGQFIKCGDLTCTVDQNSSRLTGDKARIQELEAEIIRLREEIEKRKKTEALLEAFFNYTISSVVILDRNYNLVHVNEVYAKAFSHDVSDYPGHNYFEFYPSEDKEIFDNVIKTKEIYKVSARPFTFPGHSEWGVTYWDWTLAPVLDSSGEVELLILTLHDVTEYVRIQEKLFENEERYHSIFNNSLDGILLTVPDGTILSANPSACHMFGRTEEELCAVGWKGFVDFDDPRVMKALKEREKAGSFTSEMTLLRKDGTKFYGEVNSILFKNTNGQILSSMIVRDITEHKKAEETLRLSDEKFSKAFHQSQTMMSISRSGDGRYIDVNDTLADVFGYSREELIGRSAIELNLWVDLNERQEMHKLISTNGYIKNFESKFRRKSGEIGFAFSTISLLDIGGEKYLLTSAIDITERKKTEEALRISEEKFSKLFYYSQMPMAISRLKDSTYIDVNDAYLEIMGFQREELIDKGIFAELNICCTDTQEREEKFNEFYKNGFVRNLELKVRKKTGEIAYALSSFNIIDINGEKCRLTSAIDITERKKAEEALRSSGELFHKTFNANPLPMAILSINNDTFVEVNKAFLDKNRYTRDELLGLGMTDLNYWVDLNERDRFKEGIKKEGVVRNLEVRIFKKSGGIATVLLSGVLINWNNDECVLSIINNITELKRYQHEIARLDRLNMVGQMSAGIGHEIRNPMTTVRGFLQLLKEKDRYAQDKEYMDLMIEELDRANSIITEFLSLAKDKVVELKRKCLNQELRTIFPLLRADAMKQDKNIEMELGDVPYVVIDKNEIKQLILNLVCNGLEAMSSGGLLSIKTFKDDDGVVLTVQDQGTGIPTEVLEKIGTPFLTTKDSGTGLGLAVCFSIAQRNKAKIDIETGSSGTTFYVRFIS